MPSRDEVYAAVDSERDYQDGKGVTPDGISDWLVSMRVYLRWVEESKSMLQRKNPHDECPDVLETVRKITALGVAYLERYGAPRRTA